MFVPRFLVPCLCLCFSISARAEVVINEIMYHPSSENSAEEYLELYNSGAAPVALGGWKITSGVEFTFPAVSIPAGGYLVVAANAAAFSAKYPGVTNFVAGWTGQLSNSSNTITLRDVQLVNGVPLKVDEVDYADDGDWGQRERDVPADFGHRGWGWNSEADGLGKSLELVNAAASNEEGQNWKPSVTPEGTPGVANSVAASDIAPIITNAKHFPLIPTHSDSVAVFAKITDDHASAITATLRWRLDGAGVFASTPMFDDGTHGDGAGADGVYGAFLPAQADNAIVEYYFQATDATAHTRTWPAPAKDYTGAFGQFCNCLYQVDDTIYAGAQPIYRLVMKAADKTELATINSNSPSAPPFAYNAGETNDQTYSHARFNTTFISVDGTGSKLRYLTGTRNRGNGSRTSSPQSFNVSFANADGWNGIHGLNLNTQKTVYQLLGSALFRKAGLAMAESRAIQLRWNGANPVSGTGSPAYGIYLCNEAEDSDFTAHHFPTDSSGNLYRALRQDAVGGANLRDQSAGQPAATADPTPYRVNYFKHTNSSEDKWADLIGLTKTLAKGRSVAATYTPSWDADYVTAIQAAIDVDQWMRFMAISTMADNSETNISNGDGDDYYMYFGVTDPRVNLITYDLDTILGSSAGSNSATHSLFRMCRDDFGTNAPEPIHPLMARPEFARIYFQELKRLMDGPFSAAQLNQTVDETLGGLADPGTIASIKAFNVTRTAYVASQLPFALSNSAAFTTGNVALTITNGYPRSVAAMCNVTGKADCRSTASVKVSTPGTLSSIVATYTPWKVTNVGAFTTSVGDWSATNVPLTPGINHLIVQSFDAANVETERATFDVWYDDGSVVNFPAGNLATQTWTAVGGPYRIAGAVVVPAGVTLTIQAGTTVYMASGATLTVNGTGKILASGTETQRIAIAHEPGAAGTTWGSVDFINTTVESTLSYVNFSDGGGTTIGGHNAQMHVNNSIVFFDHLFFPPTPVVEYISFDASSFIVQNSYFSTYSGTTGPESLHGIGGIKAGGYGIFRDDYFGHTYGFNDTIDFTGGNRPGPILQFINNVFDGASDDCLDLDSTDAWIEGNVFMHVHRDPTRTDQAIDTGSAISGGVDVVGQNSDWTIINNLFYDVDHVFLNKGNSTTTGNGGGRVAFLYNTVIHVAKESSGSTAAEIAAFDWADDNIVPPDPSLGSGLYAAHNIIYDCAVLNRLYFPANHTIIMDNNILSVPWGGSGSANQVVDPRLNVSVLAGTPVASVTAAQLRLASRLLPGSPAIGTGFGGRNIGGLSAHGIAISGEPSGTTNSQSATLTVGPGGTFNWGTIAAQPWGWTAYKWKLDGGAYSAEIPVTNNSPFTSPATISLSGLANGTHTVTVIGKNDAGYYQDDVFAYPAASGTPASATVSKTWTVNTAYVPPAGQPDVRINEVLAKNVETLGFSGTFPDIIELYNAGTASADLSGWGLTDNNSILYKYMIPNGTTLNAGAYLVIYASGSGSIPGPKTGFGLKDMGDTLTLTKSVAAGGTLADAVPFGAQIADYSVGRRPSDGVWDLCKPTFGAVNVVAAQGGLADLKINEWLADAVTLIGQDFVELYSPNSLPVNIGGCYLSDNPVEYPTRHQIRQLTFLAAGGYTSFKADDDVNQGPEHVNFKLEALQGEIGFFSPTQALLDNVVYGPQSSDVSEGRTPNGAATRAFFNQPTPGAPNPGALAGSTTTVSLMTPTQVWKYYANASAAPANDGSGRAYTHPLYTDTTWASGGGVLYIESSAFPANTDGFAKTTALPGISAAVPYQTYYFRTHFTFNGPIVGATLTAKLMCDDACVIYLNGVEIVPTTGTRIRMDPAPVFYSTLSTGQGPDASAGAGCYETYEFSNAQLVVGDNVLAVEVHQSANQSGGSPSSDVTWGLKLDADVAIGTSAVVMNEVLPINSTGAGWIELLNTSGTAIDISDMSLTNDVSDPRKYLFAAGTTLAANSYRVLDCNALLAASATNTHFDLTGNGGGVFLFRKLADGGGLQDSVSYGLQVPDFSLGRTPNGSGAFTLNVPTRGALNSAAGLAVIGSVKFNEWLVSPTAPPGWFEIYNTAAQPVQLSGNFFTDVLTNRTKFQIPALTFVGGSGASRWQQWLADNDNTITPGHVNFMLAANQNLGLFSASGVQIDARPTGAPGVGISQGLYPDGTGTVQSLAPTPAAANTLAPLDTDGDGLPDAWEIANGLNPNDPTDAALDRDGDGKSNLAEYLAGTNPNDPLSVLLSSIAKSAGQTVIRFTAAANKGYTVQFKSTLLDLTWQKLTDIAADPSVRSLEIPDPSPGFPTRFYRVITPVQP